MLNSPVYKYGDTECRLPENVPFRMERVDAIDPPALKDPGEVLLGALESYRAGGNPVPGGRVTIIVPDVTRPAAVPSVLPALLAWLKRVGADGGRVKILIATGAHRKHTQRELKLLVGREVKESYEVIDHDCRREEDLVNVGKTNGGIEVVLNRHAVEADSLVLMGGIGFHYLAGFGGGRKLLAPGAAGLETILNIHRICLNRYDRNGQGAFLRPGRLAENPFNEELEQILEMSRAVLGINILVDGEGRPWDIKAGHPKKSFIEACKIYSDIYRISVPEPVPLVIASAGGHPRDINLYQAHKALEHSFQVVRPKGCIILAARCAEGFGPDKFVEVLQSGDREKALREVRKNFSVAGHTAFATLLKASLVHVILVSDLDSRILMRAGLRPAGSLDEAITMAREILGEGKPAYFLPRAGQVLPVARAGADFVDFDDFCPGM
jgi:nickel-dependent lactate racemase